MREIAPDLNPIGALIYCIKICLQDYWVSLYWFVCHSSPHVVTKNTIWHQSEKVVQPAGLINGERGFLRLFTAILIRCVRPGRQIKCAFKGLQFSLIFRNPSRKIHGCYSPMLPVWLQSHRVLPHLSSMHLFPCLRRTQFSYLGIQKKESVQKL